MTIEINASLRSTQGRGASRRLRRGSKVPGILYGAGKDAQSIELDHKELLTQLKLEAFHASILNLNLGGEKQQVLLRDYQMHPYRMEVVHADFQRVAKDRKIHMRVPLHFINADIAPGVKTGKGMVQHVLSELDVTCLPDDLPEYVEVDLAELQVGHSIHLAQLKLPKGVESTQLRSGDDAVVVTIPVPKAEVEATEATAVPAAGAAPAAAPAAAAKTAAPAKKEGGDKK